MVLRHCNRPLRSSNAVEGGTDVQRLGQFVVSVWHTTLWRRWRLADTSRAKLLGISSQHQFRPTIHHGNGGRRPLRVQREHEKVSPEILWRGPNGQIRKGAQSTPSVYGTLVTSRLWLHLSTSRVSSHMPGRRHHLTPRKTKRDQLYLKPSYNFILDLYAFFVFCLSRKSQNGGGECDMLQNQKKRLKSAAEISSSSSSLYFIFVRYIIFHAFHPPLIGQFNCFFRHFIFYFLFFNAWVQQFFQFFKRTKGATFKTRFFLFWKHVLTAKLNYFFIFTLLFFASTFYYFVQLIIMLLSIEKTAHTTDLTWIMERKILYNTLAFIVSHISYERFIMSTIWLI